MAFLGSFRQSLPSVSSLVDSLGGAVEGLSAAVGQASGAFTDSLAERVTSLVSGLQGAQEWGFTADRAAESPHQTEAPLAEGSLPEHGVDHTHPHSTPVPPEPGPGMNNGRGQDGGHLGRVPLSSGAEAAAHKRTRHTPEGVGHGGRPGGHGCPEPSAAPRAQFQGRAGGCGPEPGDRGTRVKNFNNSRAVKKGTDRARGDGSPENVPDAGEAPVGGMATVPEGAALTFQPVLCLPVLQPDTRTFSLGDAFTLSPPCPSLSPLDSLLLSFLPCPHRV